MTKFRRHSPSGLIAVFTSTDDPGCVPFSRCGGGVQFAFWPNHAVLSGARHQLARASAPRTVTMVAVCGACASFTLLDSLALAPPSAMNPRVVARSAHSVTTSLHHGGTSTAKERWTHIWLVGQKQAAAILILGLHKGGSFHSRPSTSSAATTSQGGMSKARATTSNAPGASASNLATPNPSST